MFKNEKRISRRVQPTVWESLNEPVADVSAGFAEFMACVALFLLLVAWVAPHWTLVQSKLPEFTYSSSPLVNPFGAQVAGAQIVNPADVSVPIAYAVAVSLPGDVATAFSTAATQVLDISVPVTQVVDFYSPGVQAVNDAWLDLMKDPY